MTSMSRASEAARPTNHHQETRMDSNVEATFLDTPAVMARLRAIRLAQRMSVRVLSEAAGVDYNTCKNIDGGRRQELPYGHLIAVCRVLGVDPRELMTVGALEFCVTCSSSPPAGFTCNECGATGAGPSSS